MNQIPSNQNNVQLPSRGVWLPEDLYLKMAACYFGSAPRHSDPILPPPPNSREKVPPAMPQPDIDPTSMRTTPHIRMAVPRGAAARLYSAPPRPAPSPAPNTTPLGAGGTSHAG